MTNKIFVALIALLFNTIISFSQTRNTDAHITGHIIDSSNGEHIPFATVAIRGTTIGTTTDATGHFLLTNAPVGEHTLVASFVGYERAEQIVTVIADRTIEVKFELVPQT